MVLFRTDGRRSLRPIAWLQMLRYGNSVIHSLLDYWQQVFHFSAITRDATSRGPGPGVSIQVEETASCCTLNARGIGKTLSVVNARIVLSKQEFQTAEAQAAQVLVTEAAA